MGITVVLDLLGGEPAARLLGLLGERLAGSGRRVVLLDCDLARPAATLVPVDRVEEYFTGAGIRQYIGYAAEVDLDPLLLPIDPAGVEADHLALVRQGEVREEQFDVDLWYSNLRALLEALAGGGWDLLLLRLPPRKGLLQPLLEDGSLTSRVLVVGDGSPFEERYAGKLFAGVKPEPERASVRWVAEPGPRDDRAGAGAGGPGWTVSPSALAAGEVPVAAMADWVLAKVPAEEAGPGPAAPRINPFHSPPPWNALCPDRSADALLTGIDPEFASPDELLHGLARSISLSIDEKAKIVDRIDSLSLDQLDALLGILDEERRKFLGTSPRHWSQLWRLSLDHFVDWAGYLQEKSLVEGEPPALLASLVAGSGLASSDWAAEELFFLGLAERVGGKDPEAALRILDAAIEGHPDSWVLHAKKGALAAKTPDADSAIRSYDRAVKLSPPEQWNVRLNLARLLLEHRSSSEEEVDRAEALLKAILDSADPQQNQDEVYHALMGLGDIARSRGALDQAEDLYIQGLDAAREDPVKRAFTLERIVLAKEEGGETGDSISPWIDRLLEIQPLDLDSLSRAAILALRADARPQADQAFRALMALNPRSLAERVCAAEVGLLLDAPDVAALLRPREGDEAPPGESMKYPVLATLLRLLVALRSGAPTAVEAHYAGLESLTPHFPDVTGWEYAEMKEIAGGIDDPDMREWALSCIGAVESATELPRLPGATP